MIAISSAPDSEGGLRKSSRRPTAIIGSDRIWPMVTPMVAARLAMRLGQARQDRLRLGIAQADVELEQPRPLRGQHQPGVEEAAQGCPARGHQCQHRPVHRVEDGQRIRLGQVVERRVRAHPAGVGAGVALTHALVILRAAEGHDDRPVGEREEARFLAGHELLDHHFRAGPKRLWPELPAEHLGKRGLGFAVLGVHWANVDTTLGIARENIVWVSGIGCSSKTPAYFLGRSHAFNAIHGRMPSVVTGATLANGDLTPIAVSGDGDTGSIGLGQLL